MLRTVTLHGALAAFGGPYRLDVATPREAVRALILQIKGLREAIREGAYRIIRGPQATGLDLDEAAMAFRLGAATELHIVPVVSGAGSPSRGAATGKIIAGAALIAIAVAAVALGPAGAGVTTIAGVPASFFATVGIGLTLSGVAALLTKVPQQNESFIFGGDTNVTTQGGPVPLVYGTMLVGSVTISAGLFTQALAAGTLPFDPTLNANTVTYSAEPG
jgi:predicted phage tail protein